MWACRTESVVENWPTMDAAVDLRVHSEEDAVIENNRIQPDPDSVDPEHFGTFDGNMPLYSGFDDGIHTSPRPLVPSQTINGSLTPNIQVACPSEFVDGAASCQTMDDSCHDALRRQAMTFVLTAREKHRLSQRGVNDIIAAMHQYQETLVANLRSQLQKAFQQHQGSELEKDALELFNKIEDPFAFISTTYRQGSVIKKNVNFVESEEVSVGHTTCMVKKGKKRFLTTVPRCFHYVPLVRSLKQLLFHPRVLATIDEQQNYRNEYLYDIIDGELI
ncbi:hypothetical protein XENORESO_015089 [Xenotaenia resolanae]|uniref:Uncharacterized protein n=1 Tax=Xenotaenia resolanae TaxID=208358 RepID=A0ABV0WGV8_9TELE